MLADKMNTQNDLFDAIYTIATGVIESKNFDITKECKIVEVYTDTSGNRTGVYKVKSQNATYDAYAKKGETYYSGELVYVQIPNGDFNAQKFILGRKTDDDTGKGVYNFELPFDNFLGLYSLTEYNPLKNEFGFWANCPEHGSETDAKEEDLIWFWPPQGEVSDKDNIYATRLGVEVNLTTLLHGYMPISGHYGFRIIVGGKSQTQEGLESTNITKEFFFTDNNMYGNPYAYTDGSAQQILLNVEEFLQVQSIKIYFWQDHNFKDSLGQVIPYGAVDLDALTQEYKEKQAEIDKLPQGEEKDRRTTELLEWFSNECGKTSYLKNIIVKGLNIYLGIMADDKDEQLILYTYNPIKYGADPEHEEVREKNRMLRLAWIHKLTRGVQLVNTKEDLDKYAAKIYWYKYDETWTPDNEEYDETIYAHKFGGLYWRPIDMDGQLNKEITPNIDRSKDRFKAVIHYGGTYITSNVLIFTNYVDIDAAKADLAKNDKVILRCALLGEDAEGVTRLIDDDAIGDFYVYDENNNVLANDKNELFSNVRYYVEPWIKITTDADTTHDGYQRLADYIDPDGNKPEFKITWQWPENFTMISSFGQLDETVKQESEFFNNCGTAQFELYKKATQWFYVKPTYNMRYANNDIIAEIYIEGYGTFTVRKTLQFGRAEAFGAEYVPVITIASPEGNYYIDTAADFEIYCLVYDRKGRIMAEADRPNCKFTWKYIGTTVPADNRPHENYQNFQGNVIRGRIYTPMPFVVEVTVSGAAAYDLTVRRGIMVCNNAAYMQSHDIQCPDRVEFKSDGQQPLWYSSPFEVQVINTKEQNVLIYPTWQINTGKVLRLLEKEKDYPVFTFGDGTVVSKEASKQYALAFSKQYLTGSIAEPSVYGQQWTEELLDPKYFTYISYNDGDVVVAQAIAFARNLYPSSLVNEWDGQSLTLDEENSSILAKMIAAGTKDSRNRFTGVMMGDWHEKGDESLDTPGLYGFDKGGQSFGFKTDGTGFIGPAGYGRIEFDGNNALLSNPTKTCYINLNPRVITAFEGTDVEHNDEAWDGIGERGYSQYFIYCEMKHQDNPFAAQNGDDLWWREHSWATPYLEGVITNKDFFIVDPNYGVLTTGGIFARYGQIGTNTPWIIHNNGLTQKNNCGIIFLGNPEKNPSTGSADTIWPTADDGTTLANNFYSFSLANASNVIQTGARADGFLYSKFANLGGWCFNDKEIYAPNNKTFRKTYNDTGYTGDAVNLNASYMALTFDAGKLIINGNEGWMGSHHMGIAINSPQTYDMLLDFRKGQMKFHSVGGSQPQTLIDGINGTAYFSNGNVYIDGNNAMIYCGVPSDTIITDAKNGTITIAAKTAGAINLGGLELRGVTIHAPRYTYSEMYAASNPSPGGSEDGGYSGADSIGFSEGDDVSSATQLNEIKYNTYLTTATLTPTGTNQKTLQATGLLNFVENKTTDSDATYTNGMQLLICNEDTIVLKPVSTGYLGGGWNIDAKDVHVGGAIYCDNTITSKGSAYMTDDVTGTTPGIIATRAWVTNHFVNNVKPAVVTVNNATAKAMKTANNAISKANAALKKAEEALKRIDDTAITTIDLEYGIKAGGFQGVRAVGYNKDSKKVAESDGSTVSFAVAHRHKDSLVIPSNGALRVEYGAVAAETTTNSESLVIFGQNCVKINKEGTGQFSVTVKVANASITSNPFNIADTAFYKAAKVASAYTEKISGANSHIKVEHLDGSTATYDTNKLSLSEHTVSQTNSKGSVVASLDVESVYEEGLKAGWAAAASASGRSGSKVTVPTSTYGKTTSHTAHISVWRTGSVHLTGRTEINGGVYYTGYSDDHGADGELYWT